MKASKPKARLVALGLCLMATRAVAATGLDSFARIQIATEASVEKTDASAASLADSVGSVYHYPCGADAQGHLLSCSVNATFAAMAFAQSDYGVARASSFATATPVSVRASTGGPFYDQYPGPYGPQATAISAWWDTWTLVGPASNTGVPVTISLELEGSMSRFGPPSHSAAYVTLYYLVGQPGGGETLLADATTQGDLHEVLTYTVNVRPGSSFGIGERLVTSATDAGLSSFESTSRLLGISALPGYSFTSASGAALASTAYGTTYLGAVVTPVPEPSSVALFAAGLLGLAARRGGSRAGRSRSEGGHASAERTGHAA